MGGVPIKHHTKGKVGRRRSQLARKPINVSRCMNCNSPKVGHTACPNCGYYMSATARKKAAKKS